MACGTARTASPSRSTTPCGSSRGQACWMVLILFQLGRAGARPWPGVEQRHAHAEMRRARRRMRGRARGPQGTEPSARRSAWHGIRLRARSVPAPAPRASCLSTGPTTTVVWLWGEAVPIVPGSSATVLPGGAGRARHRRASVRWLWPCRTSGCSGRRSRTPRAACRRRCRRMAQRRATACWMLVDHRQLGVARLVSE